MGACRHPPFLRDQIEVIIYEMLINQQEEKDGEIRTVAVMLSWTVYGASEEWKRNSRETDPKAFIKKVIPIWFQASEFKLL